MKKYKWLIILVLVISTLSVISIVFSDDPDKYIKEISLSDVIKKQKDEDSFILYIKSTNCEHCKVFTPRLISVLKENKLKAYSLNLANLSEEDTKTYQDTFTIEGTPTVLFIDKGNESLIRIEGEQTKDVIKSKIESAGFIK